ncbi:flagellar biosynthetic protein FliO [Oceanobacillus massiliensis]|uniref:flagellar biosynthetic protein FliO n=1 Tax=Oceanobacillus massiliensis TaxID=1465765 RepID=UPI003017644B
MKEKILYSICLSIFIHTLFFTFQAEAAPNVVECMEGEVECSEQDVPANESDETNSDLLSEDQSTGSLAFELVKMFFALVLVLGLIYLLLKFLQKRNKIFNQVKALENMGGISIGQSKSLQIVRLGSRLYLIGVGENVEMLQEITDEEVIQEILRSKESSSDELPGAALLSSLIPKKKNASPDSSGNDFKALFSKELDNLKKSRNKMINKHKEDTHE